RNIIDRVALLLSSVRHRTLHSFPTRRSSDLDQEDFRHSRVANQPQTAPIEWLRLPLSTAELTDFALYTGHSGQSPEPDRLSMLQPSMALVPMQEGQQAHPPFHEQVTCAGKASTFAQDSPPQE